MIDSTVIERDTEKKRKEDGEIVLFSDFVAASNNFNNIALLRLFFFSHQICSFVKHKESTKTAVICYFRSLLDVIYIYTF